MNQICQQVSYGIQALFGPSDLILGSNVQSLSDALDIPHLEALAWGTVGKRDLDWIKEGDNRDGTHQYQREKEYKRDFRNSEGSITSENLVLRDGSFPIAPRFYSLLNVDLMIFISDLFNSHQEGS